MSKNKIVTIVYRFLPHYRKDFYNGLRELLQSQNIELNLVYGKNPITPRKDEIDIEWGIPVPNKIIKIFKHDFLWIPAPTQLLHKSDLIIIVQENKILSNYPILIKSLFFKNKIAFWGHGVNFQSGRDFLGNKIKKLYSLKVCWWFAYTQGVADIVANMGFPRERITIVQNSINTRVLKNEADSITEQNLQKTRESLQLKPGPVGLFCGGMIKDKRIEFVLLSCQKIQKIINDFQMVFIGAGPESPLVEEFCKQNKWGHYVGAKFGKEKISYFKISDIFLMPGLVGLAILDCFVLNIPLITTKYKFHSPEIEYLISGYNGIITNDTIEDYTATIIATLKDKELHSKLKIGCKESSLQYSNEIMVSNFANGITNALCQK